MVMRLDALRVLVIGDDPLARAGLTALLSAQPGLRACEVVGQAAASADLPAEVDAGRPDVVLWDLGWDPAAGLERLSEALEDLPPVVALLAEEADQPGLAGEAWAAGVRGLLRRDAGPDQLLAGLEAAGRGLLAVDPSLAANLLPARQKRRGDPPVVAPGESLLEELTPRELEVLQLLAEGLPNKAIARRLEISDHTVKYHVNAIMGKLGAQSRTDAVVRATRAGLIVL